MTILQLYGIALKIVMVAVLGAPLPQAKVDAPLTKQEVTKLFDYEKDRQGAFKGSTESEIERVGVDFELDFKTDDEFRRLGMGQDLLNTIRSNNKTGTVTVQCEPVECEVEINNRPLGTTVGSFLTKSQVMAGVVSIKVSAPNHETETAQVRLAAGGRVTVPKFTLDPVKGGLTISCEPEDCTLNIKGPNGYAKSEKTTDHRLTLTGLASGGYEVQVAGECLKPKNETVYVAAPDVRVLPVTLEEDTWCRMTPLELFDSVVHSLGGKEVLTLAAASRNTARMRLAGDPASIGMWNGVQVVEHMAANRHRWDLTIAGTKWSVFYNAPKVESKGDRNKYAGTEFAQELEHSIRLFSSMRLPAVLLSIRARFDIKKGDEWVMIAEAPDERYTFYLNEDYAPLKLLHERLTPPLDREEMEFAQYKPVGHDLVLPHVLILRYPERPKHEHIFEYDKIDADFSIRDSVFKP